MTLGTLKQICEEHNIPDDVDLLSDSGWECDATNMNGAYYNAKENTIVFTQRISKYHDYFKNPDWKPIYGEIPDWEDE